MQIHTNTTPYELDDIDGYTIGDLAILAGGHDHSTLKVNGVVTRPDTPALGFTDADVLELIDVTDYEWPGIINDGFGFTNEILDGDIAAAERAAITE